MLAAVEAIVGRYGLACRGGFDFVSEEEGPALPGGGAARSVVLIGNVGAGYWPLFQAWLSVQPTRPTDPLDAWSRMVLEEAGRELGGHPLSPSDRPYRPFQQWAMRAEGLRPSPVGILMHPRYGLWHAYRGALLFDRPLGFTTPALAVHACDSCLERPCLASCPVDAYGNSGFDHAACLRWVRGISGRGCRESGCFDRNACPQGIGHRYPQEVQAFHMAAFAGV